LKGITVNSVEITKLSNTTEYTLVSKKNDEIIEIRVSRRTDTNQSVLIDFRTQNTQLQVERVPIQPIQSLITVVDKTEYSAPYVTEVIKQITS